MELAEYARNFQLEQSYWWFVGVRAVVHQLVTVAGRGDRLGRVLDVGCGTGALLDELAPRATRLVGTDLSRDALRYCALRGHHNVFQSDATSIGLRTASVDTITAIGVIEHVDDDRAFLREMSRLLEPGGLLVLLTSSFPFLWTMHDTANHHKRRYYLRDLEKLINASGFETIRFSHLNFFLFVPLALMLWLHRAVYGLVDKPRRILPALPSPVNSILTRFLLLEGRIMSRIRLPWGVSMIGVFRKTGAAT